MTELYVLAIAVIIGFMQLFLSASAITKERGLKWNLSPRDESLPPPSPYAARMDRAFQNFKETFPFFLAAIFLVCFTGKNGTLSEIGAFVYIIARILYVPLYTLGVVGLRTFVWGASVVGIFMVLLQFFL